MAVKKSAEQPQRKPKELHGVQAWCSRCGGPARFGLLTSDGFIGDCCRIIPKKKRGRKKA